MGANTTKRCRRCEKVKPLSEFGKDKRRGYPRFICKDCDAEAHRLCRQNETDQERDLRLEKRRAVLNVRLGKAVITKSAEVLSAVQRELCKDRTGLCFRCDEPCVPGRKECEYHLSQNRNHLKKVRKERKANKLCWACGKENPEDDKKSCRECRAKNKKWRTTFREKCLDHYGRSCYCCGESNEGFLTIDHLQDDGANHRKSFSGARRICEWLVAHGFPEGFGTACWNCNVGRYHNGGICPHKEQSSGD